MNIQGSIALVTGANRGLGRALVQALLAAGAAKVYAAARDPDSVAIPGAHPIRLDITNPDEVAAAAQLCTDVTLVINNAGIYRNASIFSAQTTANARAEMETNFHGTLAVSSAFAPILKANGGGALVNILSVLSWVSLPGTAGYSASKAAAWSLTNALRNELRADGTLVVGIHVGYMDTDMAAHAQGPKSDPADVAQQVLRAVDAGREEVLADAIAKHVRAGLGAEPPVYLVAVGS
jgi:NAD(P)-dependent dehydrogenase (short-subunit alcohol dehydrogenase family)